MSLPPPRTAALQVGEFGIGLIAGYAAVAVAFALSPTIAAVLATAAVVVTGAIAIELRFGRRVAGLVAGLMPASMLTAGLFTALSLVLYRLG